jgi:hypothetical protein
LTERAAALVPYPVTVSPQRDGFAIRLVLADIDEAEAVVQQLSASGAGERTDDT